jgi:CheY-like chemotaxis protein
MVDNVVAAIRPRAEEKKLALDADVAGDVPGWLLGDEGRIAQILRNLISNALKFTERGSIRVIVVREGEATRFSVRDTGPGIAPEMQDLIFEPFRQADDSATRRYGGTGLGLSISRELATTMGGRLWVDSSPRAGSTFHCVLPLPVAQAPAPDGQPASADVTSQPLKLRVLLAEDNPVNARVATLMLRKLECTVTVAETGARVMQMVDASADDFDVVLMDVQMPDVDGLEATRAIRELESQRGRTPIPIIALTANAMKGDADRCLEAGMNGYLAKPVTLERLEREMRRVVAPPVDRS